VEDVADAADDGHDAVTDGAEEARNLGSMLVCMVEKRVVRCCRGKTYARDDGTHVDRCVW
jgi:hypothetical protein